jgi:NAD(P)-dependent dehydrogenase (short-subunit alcohol dehydrogenase family)
MSTYTLDATPHLIRIPGRLVPSYAPAAPLSAGALRGSLVGAGRTVLTPLATGGYRVTIDLVRDDHHQALRDLEKALGQAAYQFLQAEITEVIQQTAEWALGLGGTGAIAGLTSKRIEGLVVGAVAGALGGAVLAYLDRTVLHHQAVKLADGTWHMRQLPPPPPQQQFAPVFP